MCPGVSISVTRLFFKEKTACFENIVIPKQTYAIFTTEEQAYPVNDYMDIRKRIVSEWLPANSYEIKNAPEISVYHWFPKYAKEKRYIEIWLPIEKTR